MHKQLLFIALLCFGCSRESVTPTYTSVEGVWKFSAGDISGQFSLVKINGVLTSDANGFVTVSGVRYDVVQKMAVDPGKNKGQITVTMLLTGVNYTNLVLIRDCDVAESFTSMNPTGGYMYAINGKIITATGMTITR